MRVSKDFIMREIAEEHILVPAEKIIKEYDVSLETALADAEEFVQQLREVGALAEGPCP